MTCRDKPETDLRQDAEHHEREERGDVWLERVCDDAGTPMSAIAVGGGDNGLWRVGSEQHGTQLVVSHAEALRVADTLVGDPAGRLKTKMHQFFESVIDTRISSGRLVDARTTDRRRRDASGATHDRRRPGPAPADGPERSFRRSHDEARRTQSSRGQRHSR